jgi:hypothetical protein
MFFIVKNHWEPYFTDNLRSISWNLVIGLSLCFMSCSFSAVPSLPVHVLHSRLLVEGKWVSVAVNIVGACHGSLRVVDLFILGSS